MPKSFSKSQIQTLQRYIDRIPFVHPLGIKLKDAGDGYASLMLSPHIKLQNHFATYQAGSLFTLAEVSGGVACGTFIDLEKNLLLTKRGEIDFLKGVSEPLISEVNISAAAISDAKARLQASRKIEFDVLVRIRGETGNDVCHSRFIYYIREGIPKSLKKRPMASREP